MGLFGNKYQEMPDLSGKTEKEAEQILKRSSFIFRGHIKKL